MEWQRPGAEMMEIGERTERWSFDDREMNGERPKQLGHLGCSDQSEGWRVQSIALSSMS